MSSFADRVRGELWNILSGSYGTVRHGGHPTDVDEFRRARSFWPDMNFHSVTIDESASGQNIAISFTPVREPDRTYVYQVHIETAAAAWSKRVGIRDPHSNPAMFAAEIIWYMVAFIGSTPIETTPESADGLRRINKGSDVFTALPEPMAVLSSTHS